MSEKRASYEGDSGDEEHRPRRFTLSPEYKGTRLRSLDFSSPLLEQTFTLDARGTIARLDYPSNLKGQASPESNLLDEIRHIRNRVKHLLEGMGMVDVDVLVSVKMKPQKQEEGG